MHRCVHTLFPCRLLFLQPSRKPSKRLLVGSTIHCMRIAVDNSLGCTNSERERGLGAMADVANFNFQRLHVPEGCGFKGQRGLAGKTCRRWPTRILQLCSCVGT